MPPRNRDSLPRAFAWLFPLQNIAAAFAIYSTIIVFDIGTTPFILAVVATAVQVLLGIYGCLKLRPGKAPVFIPAIMLLALAALWFGPTYYHARLVSSSIKRDRNGGLSRLDHPTWSYVGLATSLLCVIFNLVMLGIASGKCGERTPTSYSSAFQNWPARHPAQAHGVAPVSSRFPPPPPQYQPPPPTMTAPDAAYLSTPPPPFDAKSTTDVEMMAPTRTSPTSPTGRSAPYDRDNRVDVIRRLCDLQHPDGHWDYSDELAGLARRWGGREVPPVTHGATALSQACLMELCDRVWTAQRDGTEDTTLSGDEVASLQMLHWDLAFARTALDRATAWLTGFR